MLNSLPNPEPEFRPSETRNRWAFIDLFVFGLFFVVMLFLIAPLAGLPVIYAIPLQGLFNLALVAFIAVWIRMVRQSSFAEYVHLFRSHVFSTRSLVMLGSASAISVLIVSAFLPSTGQTPLEKLL